MTNFCYIAGRSNLLFMNLRLLACLLTAAFSVGVSPKLSAQIKKSTSARKPETRKANDLAAECIQVLKDFAKAYSTLSEHHDKDKILAFFAPNLATVITTINIKGEVQNRYSDYREFAAYLERLTHTQNTQVNYSINKILHTIVKKNFAVIVYEAAYEILRDGELLIKGHEVNTANMVQSDNRWLISYYTIYDVAAEQQRGSCRCEIFKGEGNKYLTRTSYPSGTRYEAAMDNFIVGDIDNRIGGHLVKVRDLYFLWKRNGSVMRAVAEGGQLRESGEELGLTDDEQEMLLIILRKVLFADNCLSVRKK